MKNIEQDYVRTFSTVSGKRVLEHLKKITILRCFGANISNEELRWNAAQSALVHQIFGFISRGSENPT
ncbi:MAG: hypothetical protein ACLRFI_02505 [Alphaproteobacteria bacterium]